MKILLMLVFVLVACSKDPSTPEGLIKMYVEDVTSKQMTKDYYEKYTGGELWESISSLNDEDFESFSSLKKLKNAKVNIEKKICESKSECRLTYIIKYEYDGEDKNEFASEVKKVAELQKVEDSWKILKVSNIKSYVDSKTPINVLED